MLQVTWRLGFLRLDPGQPAVDQLGVGTRVCNDVGFAVAGMTARGGWGRDDTSSGGGLRPSCWACSPEALEPSVKNPIMGEMLSMMLTESLMSVATASLVAQVPMARGAGDAGGADEGEVFAVSCGYKPPLR